MKPINLSFFLLFFVINIYSTTAKEPDWIKKIPETDKKIYAVGIYQYKFGKDNEGLDLAKKDALKNISTFIISEIKSTMEQRLISVEKNNKSQTEEYIKSELQVQSQTEIEGVVFEEQYQDKKKRVWYILASIDKEKARDLIEKNIDPIGFELKKIFTEINNKFPKIKSLTISNFNFKSKKYSGEISGYLRSKISSCFTNLGFISEYQNPEFNQYLDQSGLENRGVTIEKSDALDNLYKDVQGFISGNYWDTNDKIEFELKLYDLKEKKYIVSSMFSVKKSIFKNIKLIPDNVDDFTKKYAQLSNIFENQSFNIKIWANKGDYSTYKDGEYLIPHFLSNKDCFLRIYLVSADGNAILLFPNYYDKNNFIKKNQVYKIGDPNYSSFKLKLSAPYGSEMLVAIASTKDFVTNIEYENQLPVFNSESLRGVIIESVKGSKNETIAQSSCVYTIIP
ncbi:MAG: hypothetical protein A2086_03150 [Spirochaetes bacterium GWD1_27_9]|nr:MAG: hypothetical protein A2086_03150 [Spirochaetes bacterium GWD1_27_9]